MAYSRLNHLRKVYYVQEYTKIMQTEGMPSKRILSVVCMLYPISAGTYYNYLRTPAKVLIRKEGTNMSELEREKDRIVRILMRLSDYERKLHQKAE